MAFRESVTVQFGADVGPFQRGLAQISSGVQNLKHELHSLGGGRIGHLFGILGVIEGFRKVYEYAKEARMEADKTGEALSDSVRIVAQIGDGWDKIKHSIAEAGVYVVSLAGRAGSFIGQKMGTASSPQDIESLRRAEIAGKKLGPDGLTDDQRKQSEETVKKTEDARKKSADARRKAQLETMNAEEKQAFLAKEINDLTEAGATLVAGTLPYYEWQIKYFEKIIELGKADKQLHDDKKKVQEEINKLKEKEADLAKAQADAATHRRDAGLPTLSELAGSHGPGGGLARQAERFERMAISRSGSAPHESQRFFDKAQQLRGQLSGKIKSGDADQFASDREKVNELFKDVAAIKKSLVTTKVGAIKTAGK